MGEKFYIRVNKPIEVGDLVRCVEHDAGCKTGDIRKVSRLGMSTDQIFYVYGSKEPCLKKDWEPVRKEVRVKEYHRVEMERAIGEIIVEMLDKENYYPRSYVIISNWRDLDNTVTALDNGKESHEAKLHPNDTWDTLTGVYVALSKAAGRKFPDWIYGEEI